MALCIVGTRWGHFLGSQLRSVFSGDLVICGNDAQRTKAIGRTLKASDCVVGWKNAIARPDISAFILALPPDLHAAAALGAIRAGKHVFVEKPLATNVEDAETMIERARSAGVVLFAGENVPYRPAIREALRLMPQIGTPRLLFGTSFSSLDDPSVTQLTAGILLDFSVHYIRTVRYLLGEPDEVYASRAQALARSTEEDNVTMVLTSAEGWQATLSLSWQGSVGRYPELVLTGSEGSMKIFPENAAIDLYPNKPTRKTRVLSHIRPWWLKDLLSSPESQRQRVSLPGSDRMGYRSELQDFLGMVAAGQGDVSSAEEALRDLKIVMAAYQSLSLGMPVSCSAVPKPARRSHNLSVLRPRPAS
jgi:predicted dehydrogenase